MLRGVVRKLDSNKAMMIELQVRRQVIENLNLLKLILTLPRCVAVRAGQSE
jgi:hypothetical protein